MSASQNHERRIGGGRAAFDQALIVCGMELSRAVGKADGVGPRRSVEAMVRAARQADMPPERTLAAFKKLLRTLPEIERLPLDDRSETTRQLVQLAIDAYYDERK